MSRMQRDKGKRGEREAAAELNAIFGTACHRGRQYHGRDDAPDVAGLPGCHVEVKRTERLSLYAALEQAIDDAGGNVPMVLHRASRRPWVAVVRLDDLPRLVRLLSQIASDAINEK